MSEFDQLLKSLQDTVAETEELAKALPTEDDKDDKKVEAAADEGADDPAAGEPEEGDDADDAEDKPSLAKSMSIDDEEVEMIDATELLKSLGDRQTNTESVLAKALEAMVSVTNKQTDLIKSMQAEIKTLGGQGRGRKTVVTVAEKPAAQIGGTETMAKSQQQDGVTTEVFFAKANSLFEAKKLSGVDLNTISVSLRGGHALDQALVQKVINTNI